MGILKNIIVENRFKPADLPKFEDKLFYEGAKRRAKLERFAVLLFLSTVIATYGVIGDSTATVIGAMIIAPLMTPIMATSAALVMGDIERAGHACLLVITGVVGVISVAWISGVIHPGVISFTTNSQITARVSPSMIDLVVALASGVAGAFAMSRDDVADSLPGVAISIALVPPLAVVGISLSHGQWNDAWGALLLFSTNFLSILLAGGGTLAFLGLIAASTKELRADVRRRAFIYIAIGTMFVAIPLSITSFRVAQKSFVEYQTQSFALKWLDQTSFKLLQIDANGDQVEIVISGSGELPPLSDLGTDLQSAIDPTTRMKLKVIPTKLLFYPEQASE
jgi:uncharacterized hydrophobic protein (TIGR00271 family)